MRTLERGHACAEAVLERVGAPPRRGSDPTAWLRTALVAAALSLCTASQDAGPRGDHVHS